jgi:hypothetical protein
MPRAPRVIISRGPSVVFIPATSRRMLDSDSVVSAAIWELDTASDSLSHPLVLSMITVSTVQALPEMNRRHARISLGYLTNCCSWLGLIYLPSLFAHRYTGIPFAAYSRSTSTVSA